MAMNRQVAGTVLGATGAFLWFMPFVNLSTEYGFPAYQAGNHIGGIAYLLLAASIASSVFSWMQLQVPRITAAALCCAVCLLFVVLASSYTAWGLIALVIVSVLSLSSGIVDMRASAGRSDRPVREG